MSDFDETYSDMSSNNYDDAHSLIFSVSHNNNGSFTEHKALSSEQVYSLMENEMKKVQEVTNVSVVTK